MHLGNNLPREKTYKSKSVLTISSYKCNLLETSVTIYFPYFSFRLKTRDLKLKQLKRNRFPWEKFNTYSEFKILANKRSTFKKYITHRLKIKHDFLVTMKHYSFLSLSQILFYNWYCLYEWINMYVDITDDLNLISA